MIIKADKEGKAAVAQLCDIALKHAGFETLLKHIGAQAMPGVAKLVQLIQPEPEKEKGKDAPDKNPPE